MLARLPEDARCNREPEDGPVAWTVHTELLAQMADSLSVLAADYRRKEPFTVPRPERDRDDEPTRASTPEEARAFLGSRVRLG